MEIVSSMKTEEKGELVVKPEKEWSSEEEEASFGNSRALNVVYNGVDKNIFRLINTCV